MSATYLDDIVAYHRERVARDTREWQTRTCAPRARASLVDALRAHRDKGISVIAEIKRRSPSRGWISENLDASEMAVVYERGGATGISVLTDDAHFAGSLEDLRATAAVTALPLLRKDFLLSANDVLDSVEAGASAILLITAILSESELRDLLDVARGVHLDVLVEVHTADEASLALDVGATMVGVNQRDLRSFDVDRTRAAEIASHLPANVVAVAESGFVDVAAVRTAARAGFDAVLVGEHFVSSNETEQAVRDFVGAPIGMRQS